MEGFADSLLRFLSGRTLHDAGSLFFTDDSWYFIEVREDA